MDRCEVRNPRTNGENPPVSLVVQFNELRNLRTRSDHTHLAAKNIPELRNLIELGVPQQPPKTSDARISRNSNQRTREACPHGPELP